MEEERLTSNGALSFLVSDDNVKLFGANINIMYERN
jgi:hypothetical protein